MLSVSPYKISGGLIVYDVFLEFRLLVVSYPSLYVFVTSQREMSGIGHVDNMRLGCPFPSDNEDVHQGWMENVVDY